MKKYQAFLFYLLLTSFVQTPYAAELPGKYVDLPHVKLWIIDSGGDGEAVVLLHPRTGNSQIWQYTVPALAKAGYRAIAIDNPGWGKSMVREGLDTLPVADTIKMLLDELQLEKAHVVGTAMGGYIALDFAASMPEYVLSLVIAASGLGLENDPEYDAFRERAAIPVMEDQPSYIRELSPNYRGFNPEGVQQWLAIYANAQQEGTARQPLHSPNSPAKLAAIQAPTLFVAGGMDLVTPSGGIRLYSRHLTVSHEVLVIPEAGHVLVWEQPEVFNNILIGFLDKN